MSDVNTDSKKLAKRIETHNKYSLKDIDKWIFEIINLNENDDVLDVGCGTGKQIIPISKNTKGKVFGVDISKDSIDYVRKNISNENVKLFVSSMEDMFSEIGDEKFDLIISCFAIYYCKDKEWILLKLKSLLKEGGRLFLCGPGLNNNKALLEVHSKVASLPEMKKGYFERFAIPFLKENFSNVEEFVFKNPISFPDVDSLTEYWLSYAIGDDKKIDEFKNAALPFFKNENFTTVKEVIGVLATR